MNKKYLVNAFSISMLPTTEPKWHHIKVEQMKLDDFARELREHEEEITSAIGHESTVNLINTLCGTSFKANRVNVKLEDGDELYVVQVLERLPEGKVLTKEELDSLLKQNKVAFIKVTYASHFIP